MIVGHIMGLPIEESVLQLAPAGAAAAVTVYAVRTKLVEIVGRIKRQQSKQ